MPSTSPTFNYIKVSNKNTSSVEKIIDAVVVANYGDPGLDENYHFDLLSRYVICKIESSNRTLTANKYKNMLVVVKRPESLWIDYEGGFTANPATQKRKDFNLNTNIGPSSSYTVSAIPRINDPYKMGEILKIKLIESQSPYTTHNASQIFQSECTTFNDSNNFYEAWHTQGLNSDSYIGTHGGAARLRKKTIYQQNGTTYNVSINNLQYEAFSLTAFPSSAAHLVPLFKGTSSYNFYYEGNGGYAFLGRPDLDFSYIYYEDTNMGGKARIPETNCMPLVVTTPNSFMTPSTRTAGTFNYNPTYINR